MRSTDIVRVRGVVLALTVALGLVSIASAQTAAGRGAIAGTVLDPFGDIAAKVVVQAKGADGETRRATSDAAGKYSIADLPPGPYDVSVTIPGLRAFERKEVRVQAGQSTAVDIRLE